MRNILLISIFLMPLLSYSELNGERIKVIQGPVVGEPMVIKSSSLFNWRGACRDFESDALGGTILEVDCGKPKCIDLGYAFYYESAGRKVISYKNSQKEKVRDEDDE